VVDGLGVVLDAAAAAASRARFAAYRRWRVFVEGAMDGERELSGNVSGVGEVSRDWWLLSPMIVRRLNASVNVSVNGGRHNTKNNTNSYVDSVK